MSYTTYSPSTDLSSAILRCPYSKCHARVIKLNNNTQHQINTGITYLKVNEQQSDDANGLFVKVEDVWDFDNIGVSRQFENKEDSELELERLIICSECERGPLGFATFDQGDGTKDVKNLKYYIHVNSVVYES